MATTLRWIGLALIAFGTFVTIRFLFLLIIPLGPMTFLMGPAPLLVGLCLVGASRHMGIRPSLVGDFAKFLVLVGVILCLNSLHSNAMLSMGETATIIGAPLALIGLALNAWSSRRA